MKRQPKKNNEAVSATPAQWHYLHTSGIKVYPVSGKEIGKPECFSNDIYIQVDNNGRKHTYDKKLKQNEVNSALASTVIHYYNKLKSVKNGE